jgi:hypothetical protein
MVFFYRNSDLYYELCIIHVTIKFHYTVCSRNLEICSNKVAIRI